MITRLSHMDSLFLSSSLLLIQALHFRPPNPHCAGPCTLFIYSFHVYFSFTTIHDMSPLTDGQTLPRISITIRACYLFYFLRERTNSLPINSSTLCRSYSS